MEPDGFINEADVPTQICAQVLKHLATGTAPNHIISSSSINGTDDGKTHENETNQDHHRLLTIALSILLDSTSPGPDPLALTSLGWAYGGGGGGGIGDWDGCHFMPGSIGKTLRDLQDQVAANILDAIPSFKDEVDEETWWWQQNHDVEYGEGRERRAARFCTIGGIAKWTKPYDKSGFLWGPPIAGLCVPSSCTADGLFYLFGQIDGFADELLQLSSMDGFNDKNNPGIEPPTASRRFRYMSSLALSFNAGVASQMGVVCEGESGLRELDDEDFVSQGFYATMTLIFVLCIFVFIGTNSSKKHRNESQTEVSNENNATGDNQHSKITHVEDTEEKPMSLNGGAHNYGSTLEEQSSNVLLLRNEFDEEPKYIRDGNDMQPLLSGTEGNAKEDDGSVNVNSRLPSASSFTQGVDNGSSIEQVESCYDRYLKTIKSLLESFDASQSFYEITRMKNKNPQVENLHERCLRKNGQTSIDTYNSHNEIFPIYRDAVHLNEHALNHRSTISMSSSQCLNGMRSISMLWIIFGHTMAVQSSIGYVNPAAVLPPSGMMSSTLGTFFLSSRYAVDTFFFIGGYLVMSGLLKKLDPKLGKTGVEEQMIAVAQWKRRLLGLGLISSSHFVTGDYVNRLRNIKQNRVTNLMWIFPFLLHRILRILPTYGFVLLLWWKVAVKMGEGPFWPRWATLVAQCDAKWWTNLLFINNLVPREQPYGETSECMYHAWYLGIDFQLCAILTPIFVSLFLKEGFRRITIAFELILIASIIGISAMFSQKYGWSAHLFDGADTISFDRDFYINPFFRSTPYIIGFITAQLWHEKCRLWPHMGLSKLASWILSCFSVFLLLFMTIGTCSTQKRPCLNWESPHSTDCGSGWSQKELAIYNSLVRPAWGSGLAVMSLLSFNGQFCFFFASSVLQWRGWDPIARLSFSMYLLHPLIINIWVFGSASKFRYSHVNFFYAFAGIVTTTFIAAIIVGVMVEWPMSKITRRLESYLWQSNNEGKVRKGDEMQISMNEKGKALGRIHNCEI